MRLADPRPGYCSVCGNSHDSDTRFWDMEASFDGPVMLDENGLMVLSPGGAPSASEELFICDPCAKTLAELAGHKPELSGRQLREIKRLEVENRHWRDTAKRAQAELNKQLDAGLSPPSRRKVAA